MAEMESKVSNIRSEIHSHHKVNIPMATVVKCNKDSKMCGEIKKKKIRVSGKVAQGVKALAAKPDPWDHIVE